MDDNVLLYVYSIDLNLAKMEQLTKKGFYYVNILNTFYKMKPIQELIMHSENLRMDTILIIQNEY